MFRQKTCVLLGATDEMGIFIAQQFAMERFNIAFLDSNLEKGNWLKKTLHEKYGVNVFFFHGRFFSEEDLEIFAGSVIEQFGMIDFFLNHVIVDGDLLRGTDSFNDLQTLFQISVLGPYILDKKFKNHFGKISVEIFDIPAEKYFIEEDKNFYCIMKSTIEAFAAACAEKHEGIVHTDCMDWQNEDFKREILRIICHIQTDMQKNSIKMVVYPDENERGSDKK